MLLVWIVGVALQRSNGFSLPVITLRRPTLTIGAIALGVAIWCVVLDGFVFRSALPAGYFAFEQQPLWLRLIYYCSRAFNENVLYRLFLGSLFAWALRGLWADPKLAFALSMLGMIAAQLINVAVNVSAAGVSLESAIWALLRFVLPGILWAYLYVRHGFTANEGAAMGVHCFLQPMVSFAF